jgi:hypothetical protein
MESAADSDGLIKADGLSLITVAVFLAGITAGVGVLALPKAVAGAGEQSTNQQSCSQSGDIIQERSVGKSTNQKRCNQVT